MADEIKFGYPETGNVNIEADVLQPDGSARDLDIVLSDTGHLGLYMGDSNLVESGDIVRIEDTDSGEILAIDELQACDAAITAKTTIIEIEEGVWQKNG